MAYKILVSSYLFPFLERNSVHFVLFFEHILMNPSPIPKFYTIVSHQTVSWPFPT